jgi:hypothetical protein
LNRQENTFWVYGGNKVKKKLVITLFFVMIATAATMAAIPASVHAAPYCGITWGSGAKVAGQHGTSAITNVRTGQHDCYDRMVIDLNGSAPGYNVSYVSDFFADGSGMPIPLQGGAKLRITALAPAYDINESTITSTYLAKVGQTLPNINLTGYQTFRDLRYGGSFEGQTTFGLGVRALLPFRVFQLDNRLVIDVGHRWQQ